MATYREKIIDRLLKAEANPKRLAWSITLGFYLAFSPFLGIQTFLVFILAYLLAANSAVVFIVLYTINNPWTMLPIAAMDYAFGHWFTEVFLGLDLDRFDPAWMNWVNAKLGYYLAEYLGIEKLCFWCFMIGGNIIAVTVAAISYPFVKQFCARIIQKYSVKA